MNWAAYRSKFTRAAQERGLDEEYISLHIEYARPLFQRGLPVIFDQIHLSKLVGYDISYLRRASSGSKHFYRTFEIEKKSGGTRRIAEPLPSLKEIQRWILDNVVHEVQASRFAKAYMPGGSVRANARFHRDQEMVLSLDVTDFFGALRYPEVHAFYKRLGYCLPVATMLGKLCTLDESLPQGAPPSGPLSNLLMRRVDKRLSEFALANGLRYTRYADDITFSGTFDPGRVIRLTREVFDDEGLELNESKTRLMLPHQRQEVTGIVVNEKLQVPREMRRNLRQAVYYIEKYGLGSHLEHTDETRANHVRHLMGIANFILFVNEEDRDAKKALDVLRPYLDPSEE